MKPLPSFKESLPIWLKIGCLGFGGPSGQIALLHSEIVEKQKWVRDDEFARALQFCMLLPGPEAQQLATYLGWRLNGIRGGIAAGVFFFLPAAILLWGLSLLYVTGQHAPLLMAFFAGLKPAVVAIVASACWRIGKRTVTSFPLGALAVIAFILLSFTYLPYPFLVLGFGVLGGFFLNQPSSEKISEIIPTCWQRSLLNSLLSALSIITLWVLPIAALLIWLGPQALPVKVGLFFAKVAVVSFGGAYAALSYVSLHAAGDWGWLTSGQMMDGLGLAETTPGPLLIALQFVAFLAAYHSPGILSPLLAATLASLAAIWSLFGPSFLWIFSLAPHIERLTSYSRIAAALSAIGAVVIAVIAHLWLWFSWNLFFPHGISYGGFQGIAWTPLLIALLALTIFQSQRLGMISVILLSGGAGILLKLF